MPQSTWLRGRLMFTGLRKFAPIAVIVGASAGPLKTNLADSAPLPCNRATQNTLRARSFMERHVSPATVCPSVPAAQEINRAYIRASSLLSAQLFYLQSPSERMVGSDPSGLGRMCIKLLKTLPHCSVDTLLASLADAFAPGCPTRKSDYIR